ncbi:hypothetical protein CKW48_21320, partial [Bordetella pertussis]
MPDWPTKPERWGLALPPLGQMMDAARLYLFDKRAAGPADRGDVGLPDGAGVPDWPTKPERWGLALPPL